MGVTKTELFTDEQNALAQFARALAHPARIAILQRMAREDSCINSHLVLELGLAQATISQHLRELKDAGLIKGMIDGASVSYCIDPECWQVVRSHFTTLFDLPAVGSDSDCCAPVNPSFDSA